MRVLIIEDEKHTAQRLKHLISECNGNIEICALLSSVASSISWFGKHELPDLIFQDIELSDGNCFEIYQQLHIDVPIIFTTAYSEFALKSFELNSIDYLVKPYDTNDIKRVLDKFKTMAHLFQKSQPETLQELVSPIDKPFRTRFLVHLGDTYKIIRTKDLAYFMADEGLNFAYDFGGAKYPLNQTLNELTTQLDPEHYFRISRSCILNHHSIKKISSWFNSRLKLELEPAPSSEVIVSRERVREFKTWLGE